MALTVLWHHAHPYPTLENPEILLGQIPKVDSSVGFEVECQLPAVPVMLASHSPADPLHAVLRFGAARLA